MLLEESLLLYEEWGNFSLIVLNNIGMWPETLPLNLGLPTCHFLHMEDGKDHGSPSLDHWG